MAIELESQKMFANYFDNGGATAVAPSASGGLSYSISAEDDPTYAATNWTGVMTVITALFYMLGVSGVIGGLYALRSQVGLEAAEILMKRIGSTTPDAKLAVAMLGAQLQYSVMTYSVLAFRILTGFACFGVAAALTKRTDNANNMAMLVVGMVIFYNLAKFFVDYLITSSVIGVADIDPAFVDAALMTFLAVGSVMLMIKIGVYCGISYYMSRPSAAAIFQPTA